MTWADRHPRFELALTDPDYPHLLRDSPQPPERLYGYGDPAALVPGIAIVGARKATPYGLRAARMLAGWAGEAGYVVISGAAIGCDQEAHIATLETGGRTVAVLGCGADIAYPSRSGPLLSRIAGSGCVISEHPWGTGPRRWAFRTRNRIIAGLSRAVLVVEAALGSGTFSTADYALDAGREVWTVPGSIYAPECSGSNRLLRQGALPILDADDLRAAAEPLLGPPRKMSLAPDPVSQEGDALLAALRANAARPDDLARALGTDIVTIARALGRHEAMGLVVRASDGRYALPPDPQRKRPKKLDARHRDTMSPP